MLNERPHLIQNLWTKFISFWTDGPSRASSTSSSAQSRCEILTSFKLGTSAPVVLLSSSERSSRKILKSSVDMGCPCSVPTFTSRASDSFTRSLIFASEFEYISLVHSRNLSSIPKFASLKSSASLLTVSKAFLVGCSQKHCCRCSCNKSSLQEHLPTQKHWGLWGSIRSRNLWVGSLVHWGHCLCCFWSVGWANCRL